MNNDKNKPFEIVMHAGSAKSKAMDAIYSSRNRDFSEAEKRLSEAKDELILAHKELTKMLVETSQGYETEMNIFYVHALDHISMASTAIDLAEEAILIRKEMF